MTTKEQKRLDDLKFWSNEVKPVATFSMPSLLGAIYLTMVTPMTHNEVVFYTLMAIGLVMGFIIGCVMSNQFKEEIKAIESREENKKDPNNVKNQQ